MVGPKPKPVRPLNTSKPGFEKHSEIKTVGKKKSKKVETKPQASKEKVGKDVSKVSVKPSESKPKKKTADKAPAPVPSKDTKVEGALKEMPAYPEPGKVEIKPVSNLKITFYFYFFEDRGGCPGFQ